MRTLNDAAGQTAKPALGSHIADLTPRRMRTPGPHQHQNGAERFDDRGQNDDENREKSDRPESAQARSDGIVRRRCGSRFFKRERRDVLWQIRGVTGHALFQKYVGPNENGAQLPSTLKIKVRMCPMIATKC
jgi:hypothetical protein